MQLSVFFLITILSVFAAQNVVAAPLPEPTKGSVEKPKKSSNLHAHEIERMVSSTEKFREPDLAEPGRRIAAKSTTPHQWS